MYHNAYSDWIAFVSSVYRNSILQRTASIVGQQKGEENDFFCACLILYQIIIIIIIV